MNSIPFLFLSLLATSTLVAQKQPDIVVIMADDAGYSISLLWQEIRRRFSTNSLSMGCGFRNFTTPDDAASRAALLTGVYQHQAGMGHMSRDRESQV